MENLLQGHLAIYDYLQTEDENTLNSALESYKSGFAHVAKRHVGSSGAASIPSEFKAFRQLFHRLPLAIQAGWQAELRAAGAIWMTDRHCCSRVWRSCIDQRERPEPGSHLSYGVNDKGVDSPQDHIFRKELL